MSCRRKLPSDIERDGDPTESCTTSDSASSAIYSIRHLMTTQRPRVVINPPIVRLLHGATQIQIFGLVTGETSGTFRFHRSFAVSTEDI